MPGCEYQHLWNDPVYSETTVNSGYFSRKIICISHGKPLTHHALFNRCRFGMGLKTLKTDCRVIAYLCFTFAFFKAIVISCSINFCNWIICAIMCHTLSNLWSKLVDTDAACWHSTPLDKTPTVPDHQCKDILSLKFQKPHGEHWKTTQYTFTGKLGYL